MISLLVSILGTNFFTTVFKRAVEKYGDTGVHLIVFLCSVIASCIILLAHTYPNALEVAKSLLLNVAKISAGAVTLYEVVWKQIGKITNF